MLVGTTLCYILESVLRCVNSYTELISQVRGSIPNQLASHLDYNFCNFKISAFASLGEVVLGPSFTDKTDSTIMQNVSRYNDLATDINKSVLLSRMILRSSKPVKPDNTKLMNYTTKIISMIEEVVWSDEIPMISTTLNALLTISVASGKEGYKAFLTQLCHNSTLQTPDEPLFPLLRRCLIYYA